jgi:HAD superfamily hydrolase (TIGR01549 family)
MDKIANLKLVSVDLYQTLIDIRAGREAIWKAFLGDKYTEELCLKYSRIGDEVITRKFLEASVEGASFKNERTIFEETFADLFREIHLNFDYKKAADAMMAQHQKYKYYPDAHPFLEAVSRKYPVCLSTDCDKEMLDGIGDLSLFDQVFTSEKLQSYKLNPQFFQQVLKYYGLKPENVLHIGDSRTDILVPNKLGVLTCWVNRFNRPWSQAFKPDFEVKSLFEILDILGLPSPK